MEGRSETVPRSVDKSCSEYEAMSITPDSGERCDLEEWEWEDGSLPTLSSTKSGEGCEINGVTVEFDVSPDPAKRKTIRRATAEEKELAELVHKVNLLCLLGRGRSFDSACNDPLIQSCLRALLPPNLLKIVEVPELTAKSLTPLVNWFHNTFRVLDGGSAKSTPSVALAHALEAYEGTAEEVAALSVALFRALNLSTRFVAVLDVISLKPDMDKPEASSRGNRKRTSGIFNSPTLMVTGSGHSLSPLITPSTEKDGVDQTFAPGEKKINSRKLFKDTSGDNPSTSNPNKMCGPSTSEVQGGASDACLDKNSEGQPKRRGDVEFEMQLEMALSATALESSRSSTSSKSSDPTTESKVVRREKSPVSASGVSTAIGSRKLCAPLYWAEVYCSGEQVTGKWVHIDTVNAIIDGEQKVEAAVAACKKSLRYAVAFAGLGAKDVTRRYCAQWYKISPQRVDSIWWDAVLAPLKELESRATGKVIYLEKDALNMNQMVEPQDNTQTTEKSTGAILKKELGGLAIPLAGTISSFEDMELETKSLTEPLPTNQQAYRNHQLYAIERWLNKYEVLHPKGPVLGFCSGHPVYPRTCVQTVHTRERWLREGCQVKLNELPVKILKRSLKHEKAERAEDDDLAEGGQVALFGKWQTEPLCLPHAVDGIVPKNERGQVDVWSEKCLPPGTIHLRLPRVALVAKRLEIDYAPAMVGFEYRSGRSLPVFEGIVVCTEFKDAILEAYYEEEDRRQAEERRKDEAQALSRWYQLLSSLVTRQRLKKSYGDNSLKQTSPSISKPDSEPQARGDGSADLQKSPDGKEDNKLFAVQFVPTEDHEHVFLMDDESFDAETSTRTKRCRCGFSIEYEQL